MGYCGNCGAALPAGGAFCPDCGHPVGAPVSAASPPPSDAEQTSVRMDATASRAVEAPPAAEDPQMPSTPSTPPPPQSPPPGAPAGPGHSAPLDSGFAPYAAPPPRRPAPPYVAKVLHGNWKGVVLVAATAFCTSGLLAVLVGLGSKQRDLTIKNTFTLIGGLWAGAFGADTGVSGKGSASVLTISGGLGVGFMPLTITLVTLWATVLVFRRVTRAYASGWDALIDAARAALLAALPMIVMTLLLRSGLKDLARNVYIVDHGHPPASDADLDIPPGLSLHVGPHVGASFFLTFLTLVVVLGAVTLLRQDWWRSPVMRRISSWASAPLAAFGWLLTLTPIAGAIVAVLVLTTGSGPTDGFDPTAGFDTRDWIALAMAVAAYAANAGIWALSLGSLGSLHVSATVLGQHDSVGRHLGYFTGDPIREPGLWASVAVAPLLLAVATWIVIRRSGYRRTGDASGQRALRGLIVWLLGLVVAVPLMLQWSGLHASAHVTGLQPIGGFVSGSLEDCTTGEGSVCLIPPDLLAKAQAAATELTRHHTATGSAHAGPALVTTTLLILAYALIIAVVLGLVTGVIDPRRLRRPAPSGDPQQPDYPQQPGYPQQAEYLQLGRPSPPSQPPAPSFGPPTTPPPAGPPTTPTWPPTPPADPPSQGQ